MIRKTLAALATLGLTACGPGEPVVDTSTPWQEVIAKQGLESTIDNLAARPPSAETDFLLGGMHFLRATEAIMRVRYENSSTPLALLPGMRNELPSNPEAKFSPDFLERAMSEALVHLAAAETALGRAAGKEFAVEIPLTSIWFDIDQDGTRSDWESGLAIMQALNADANESFDGIIRFDSADAHWLKAYVHVMSGMAELTLASDPTPAIKTVFEGRQELDRVGATQTMFIGNDELDTLAAVLLTLRGTPDQTRTRAALKHFKAMVAENRKFWTAVRKETDNDHEWLPNPAQTSAFGVEVTEEMARGWQEVLVEIEDLLEGKKLVPYWRAGNPYGATEGLGVNLAKFLEQPGDMDLILWIHGAAAAPYLERGSLAQMDAWDRFTNMTRGDGLMFALWFN